MVQKVEGVKPSGHNTVTPAVELFLPPPVLTMENGRHAAEKDIFFGGVLISIVSQIALQHIFCYFTFCLCSGIHIKSCF